MASVTKAMAAPESGLEVRDRMWLKITIPNAFLGTRAWDVEEEEARAGNEPGRGQSRSQRDVCEALFCFGSL